MFGNSVWPWHRLHLCSAVFPFLSRYVNRGHWKPKFDFFLKFIFLWDRLCSFAKTRNAQAHQKPPEDCVLRDQILKSTAAATRSLYSILTAALQTYISISLYDVAGDAVLHCKVTGSNYMNHKPSICCSNWSPLITQSDRLWSALSSWKMALKATSSLKQHQIKTKHFLFFLFHVFVLRTETVSLLMFHFLFFSFLQCLNLPNLFIYDSAYLFICIFIFVQCFFFFVSCCCYSLSCL